MKAAVFYDVKDIRLEDVPEPGDRPRRRRSSGARLRVLRLGHRVLLRAQPGGTPDGKGPLVLGPRVLAASSSRLGKLADRYGLAEGDRVVDQPGPELQRLRHLPAGQPALRS